MTAEDIKIPRWAWGLIGSILAGLCLISYNSIGARIDENRAQVSQLWSTTRNNGSNIEWIRGNVQGLKTDIPRLEGTIKELTASVQALTVQLATVKASQGR